MAYSPELLLPQTESTLAELAANGRFGAGEHIDHRLAAGDIAIELGCEEFDPAFHDLDQIDFMIEEGIIDGNLYVPTGLAAKPLLVHVATDKMARAEDPRVTRGKQAAADSIGYALKNSVPQTDLLDGSAVTDIRVSEFDFQDKIYAETRVDGTKKLERIALDGLVMVISDFHDMDFSPGSLKDVLAVKVNHLLERKVPYGIGFIPIGREKELNTNRSKKVDEYNVELERMHEHTLSKLDQAGAVVVSLVVDHVAHKAMGFDAVSTDRNIARTLESIGE